MKKIIVILVVLFTLLGCSNVDRENLKTYEDMASVLNDAKDYVSSSEYFDISVKCATVNDEERYYVTIDNPRIAMYDVKAMAFEDGSDIDVEFAPNVGIFDEIINLVPNQINRNDGFVKGITISGVCRSESPVILCLVQWINEDNSKVYREYFKFDNSVLYNCLYRNIFLFQNI